MDYLLEKEGGSSTTIEISAQGGGHKLLPPECIELETICLGLNRDGLVKIVEYARDIADNPRYKKEQKDFEVVENRTA
jgi:hypothetical protein